MPEPIPAQLFAALQVLLPHHLLSRLTGALARCRWVWLKNLLIDSFVRVFKVDLSEAEQQQGHAYPHFNAFFTRALQTGARPLASAADAIVSPADGSISQLGGLDGQHLLQAKGRYFSASALLGSDDAADAFSGGQFITVYLSPRDYHRVHMPCAARLSYMRHIPGRLFSVNHSSAQLIDRLFARNERLVCGFETDHGPLAMVLVGAMIVAGIETVWAGPVVPPSREPRHWRYDGEVETVHLARGAEMGRFQLGSTVILLFPPNTLAWDTALAPGTSLRMGQEIGRRLSAAAR